MRSEVKKNLKKHTGHERMHVFGALSTRGTSGTHTAHTDHERKYLIGGDVHTRVHVMHNARSYVHFVNTMSCTCQNTSDKSAKSS